jgi:glycosyltransferase involved in cell wall biosynthesis
MQEEVFARMKASRVFVLPSEREGFGIVAIEANSCGLPVITVTWPQNASCDLIVDGKNGFLCQPLAESIAEKILAVLGNGCLASECESFAQAHDWNNTARMAESVYEQALSAR